MSDGGAPPPPPPPHGSSPRPPGGLPDGSYDIFIIPPHSAGSGFLYLPSMQPHRNSFLLGVACTLLTVGLWTLVMPVLKQWLQTLLASGGVGVFVLVIGVGVAAWAWGKTQGESSRSSSSRGPGSGGAGASAEGTSHRANGYAPPPKPQQQEWQAPPPPPPPPQPESAPPPPQQEAPKPEPPKTKSDAASGWERAREETRKREEERKRAEELRKRREEASRLREEAERAARAKAEKEKWEQARAREKEQREKEARERIARERLAREKEQREKDTREREAREKEAREKDKREREARERLARAAQARAASASAPTSPAKSAPSRPAASKYEKPAATSYLGSDAGGAHSFRPYDPPPTSRRPAYKSSASSISGLSESSYAPSQSTARTTPPPSARGPYSTKDPDKIQIKGVYLFSDSFPNKPLAQLISNTGSVTDGLVLRIKSEGLFIDDDIRGVPQREWDVKAWTLKSVEDGVGGNLHVVRATARDAENKKFVFVLEETEAWKVAVGLQRLRKGGTVRGLGVGGMKEGEVKGLLGNLGWV